jgi:hypothetical protein
MYASSPLMPCNGISIWRIIITINIILLYYYYHVIHSYSNTIPIPNPIPIPIPNLIPIPYSYPSGKNQHYVNLLSFQNFLTIPIIQLAYQSISLSS